jgi:site-specific recombinase XerD
VPRYKYARSKAEEAEQIFEGYGETRERRRRLEPQTTDYAEIFSAYEDHSAGISKGGALGRDHAKNLSQARKVLEWLQQACPSLPDLTPDMIRDRLVQMKGTYTEWSLHHYLTKLRLLLDQALLLNMIPTNPAREVSLRRDLNVRVKAARTRRILSAEEARALLAVSLDYRQYLNGGLPTIVRLGLYAGLRNEEMCWLPWRAIEWDQRILNVQESVCERTGESWVPKDYEARRLDVKRECIDYLQAERQRQEEEGLLGPFVLPAGTLKNRTVADRLKPVHPDTPSKSFAKMIQDEGMDPAITVYSLRHTYATMALRNGVDLRTVQRNMGHSDIRTTMDYLHHLDPEQHPMDSLPPGSAGTAADATPETAALP